MYLVRFLDFTLDTCQDTSGYMYLGLFITIHQDTPRYKITIHVSSTRHDDTSRYNQSGYITIHVSWTLRPSRAGYTKDTLEIHCEYIQDTYPGLVLSALLPKELKSLRLYVAGIGLHLGLALKGWHRCLPIVPPHEPRLLLQGIRLNRLELKAHVELLHQVVDGQHVGADAHLLERLARNAF